MGKLFGELYGYWEPPSGWRRTSDPGREKDAFLGGESIEFRHDTIGTLTVFRDWGFDDVPLQFTLVLRTRPSALPETLCEEIARIFQPSDWEREGSLRWDHACTVSWRARPMQLESFPIVRALGRLFGWRG